MSNKWVGELCFGSKKRNVIEEIRNSDKPLVIWGNGVIAHIIMAILEEFKISISAICVDVHNDIDEFCGIAIKGWDEIDEQYESYDVIVGHSSYELGSSVEAIHGKIHKMFYFPSVDYRCDLFREELIKKNIDRYKDALGMLEDDKSRVCIIAFLNTRMSGDASYVLNVFEKKNSFFKNDIYEIGSDEVYWDIGACDGDTIEKFLEESKREYKQIIALEPDTENMKKLRGYIDDTDLKDVYTFEVGAWDRKTELMFKKVPNKCSGIVESETGDEGLKIKADTLDHILESNQNVKPPTLLKYNYDLGKGVGGVMGATQILSRHSPKIAIGIGFGECSFVDIIGTIKAINSHYKLYARFNTGMASTICLYGICKGEGD